MSKIIPIFQFAWICLSVVGYFLYIDTVQSDLNARSKAAVSAAGYDSLTISQRGRDLSLQGSAPDEDTLIDAADIVRNVYGVRVVETDEVSIELPDQTLLEIKSDDTDSDGVINSQDAFPDHASEQLDHDVDGIGDNSDADISDMDGDGVSDSQDIYPNDDSRWSNEQIETSSNDENLNSYNPCSIDIGSITSHTMIYFQTGSSIVNSEGIGLLRKLAALLNDCPFYYVNIIGHTDLRGSQSMNQQLSDLRAANVETQLIDLGVYHRRINTSGVAASSPTSDNTTTDGLAGNRRVEIALTQ